jgi:hypothetical protein
MLHDQLQDQRNALVLASVLFKEQKRPRRAMKLRIILNDYRCIVYRLNTLDLPLNLHHPNAASTCLLFDPSLRQLDTFGFLQSKSVCPFIC